MNARFILGALFMIIITSFALTACERHGAIGDLEVYMKDLKSSEANKKRKSLIAELKIPEGSTYKEDNVRSPFAEELGVADAQGVSSNPLLAYPLNVLRFVGTLSQGQTIYAFVMTPDNMVYQVKVGDLIGDHKGKVVNIKPNEVNVVEQETENASPGMQRKVSLELKEG